MGPHKILLAAVIALLPSSTSFRVPTRAARFKDNNSLRVERRGHSPSSSSYADRRDLSRRFYSSPYEPEPEQLELIDIIGPAVIESLSQADSPSSRYYESINKPSLVLELEPSPPMAVVDTLPKTVPASESETEAVLKFFGDRLLNMVNQTSSPSSSADDDASADSSDSFIVEGRRMLSCQSVSFAPPRPASSSPSSAASLALWSELRSLLTMSASDAGAVLVCPDALPDDFVRGHRNLLSYLGYDPSSLLLQSFTGFSPPSTVFRMIKSPSSIPAKVEDDAKYIRTEEEERQLDKKVDEMYERAEREVREKREAKARKRGKGGGGGGKGKGFGLGS